MPLKNVSAAFIATVSFALAFPALAESVHISTSESEHVRESVHMSNGEETTDNSYDARSITCTERNGEGECVMTEKSGETEEDASTTVRVLSATSEDSSWWEGWADRLMSAWRGSATVLSDEDGDGEEEDQDDETSDGLRERVGTRLVRRVCSKLTEEDRTDCLTQALGGSVMSIREEIREWIDRVYSH